MVPGGLSGVTIPPDWLWIKGSAEPSQYLHRARTAAGTRPDTKNHMHKVGIYSPTILSKSFKGFKTRASWPRQ